MECKVIGKTTNGTITLNFTNPTMVDKFQVGEKYEVTFVLIPREKDSAGGTFDQAAKEGYKNAMEGK